ncbi:MAG: D-glycero-beta-D-manno-heptose-7-phosphate kinase [Bryobacteraceae bacterium]|nr:D-glycero-beta-D-manno-heptose-7-phosphate kinase [Bryobacteraceae bacterium]
MFTARRVLVVGDAMLDEYLSGEARRVSPEAPIPVVEVRSRTHNAGGAGNVASNLTALGADVSILAVTGEDPAASLLSRALASRGVDTTCLLSDAHRPTTVKTRVIAQSQQVARIDVEDRSPLSPALENRLLANLEAELSSCDAVVLSDYAKGVLTPRVCRAAIELAAAARCPVVVDPKCRDFSRYRDCTVITPNLLEARAAALDLEESLEVNALGRALLQLVARPVLITRGAGGMSLFQPDRAPMHLATTARAVFDVTGAGDTVVAVLALALAGGAPLPVAARLANAAAGIVVGKLGAAVLSPAEIASLGRFETEAEDQRPTVEFTRPAPGLRR